MHRTTIHTASFRLVYGSPQRSNVFTGIKISIIIVSAVVTFKDLIVSFADMVANGTRLRGICRIDNYKRNTTERSLVSEETTQLSKIPSSQFSPEFLISSLRSKSNIRQLFDSNSFALFLCRFNDRLCNGVIDNCRRSLFSAFKPFQQSPRTACAFALNRTTYGLSLFPVFIQFLCRMFFPIGCNGNIRQSKIAPNKLFYIGNGFIRDVNRLKKIEFPFPKYKISFAFYVRQVIFIMAKKRHPQPSVYCPNRRSIMFVAKNPAIVSDRAKRFEFTLNLFIKFISIANLAYAAHQNLTTKIKRGLKRMVNFLVNFELIKNPALPSNIRYGITTDIGFFDSFQKSFSLVVRRQQLYFQCQFHNTNLLNLLIFETI